MFNDYLEANDEKRKLHCLSKEELMDINQNDDGGNDNAKQSEDNNG